MSQPNNTDFEAPFDPTGYVTISGAQLLQLTSGLIPFTDKGLIVATTDIATVPQVPNANITTKWINYAWLRISATSVGLYLWNPNATPDATFLNWVSVSIATIGAGSIVDSMIADNTITDSKIASLNYSKLTGTPPNLPPSGAAGGDLVGSNYPNPVLAPGVVTGTKIAASTIVGNNIAAATVTVDKLANDGIASDMLRVNAAANAMEFFAPQKLFLSAVGTPTANVLKAIQVNAAATDYQFTPNTIQQVKCASSITPQATNTNLALTGTAPTLVNTTLITGFGAAGAIAFTPVSSTSTVVVDVTLQLSNSSGFPAGILFNGATPVASGLGNVNGSNFSVVTFSYVFVPGALTALTFKVTMVGTAGTTNLNSDGGTATGIAATLSSSVKITEYI